MTDTTETHQTFIARTTREILAQGRDLRDVSLVVPGRRAALFFKREIARQCAGATFLPRFFTIEDLAGKLSRLEKIGDIPLLFEFYRAYLSLVPAGHREPFDVFTRWGQTLLADFNDIDRYMLPPQDVFATLQDVEHIENWNPSDPLSPLMAEHKNFWHLSQRLYHALRERLLSQGKGYDGMVIRRAAENASRSADTAADDSLWVFAGFNALSRAEEVLTEYFIREKGALAFYDADRYYLDNPRHSAGTFLRRLKDHAVLGRDFRWAGGYLEKKKNLRLIGVPGKAAQGKAAAKILREKLAAGHPLEDTALVLCDESLLVPVLSSLPEEIPAVNVTMGYPLSALPSSALADALFSLYSTPDTLKLKGYYHKDVVQLLRHNIVVPWLTENGRDYAGLLCRRIAQRDLVDFLPEKLDDPLPEAIRRRLGLFFGQKPGTPAGLARRILEIVDAVRRESPAADDLTREYLFKLSGVLSTLCDYLERYPGYIENLPTLASFYRQAAAGQKLDFYGEPLEGLQLMGLLETRLLDFKNLILTGVNEGILPAGKTDNSFIPYDVKRHFDLPTYSQKDAVYSYHFFRLLQRAENIAILYNTDASELGQAEPSRFLLQLRHDFQGKWDIAQQNLSYLPPALPLRTVSKPKTPFALGRIREILAQGLSPSTLNMYLCNPMEFYYRKVLGVGEPEEVEETAAANTMGTIVHETLRRLYEPTLGRPLTAGDLAGMIKISDHLTREVFEQQINGKDYSTGKNYLIFEAVKRMVANFLQAERSQIESGSRIVIHRLETSLDCTFDLLSPQIPVRLKGQADRIDTCDGTLRIIDYKTGRTDPAELRLSSMDQIAPSALDPQEGETLFTRPKAVQVLMYAYMFAQGEKSAVTAGFQAGILSLRHPSAGLIGLNFTTEKARTYRCDLTPEDLDNFAQALKNALENLLDPSKPFIEAGDIYYDI